MSWDLFGVLLPLTAFAFVLRYMFDATEKDWLALAAIVPTLLLAE